MNILFVCRYNRFRSKVAEAFFRKYNKNKKYKIKNAGLIKGTSIGKEVKESAKKFEIKVRGRPQGISSKLIKWQDLTVIVANDFPIDIFKDNKKYGKKLIVWKIKDTNQTKHKEREKIMSFIQKRVLQLIKDLEKEGKNLKWILIKVT